MANPNHAPEGAPNGTGGQFISKAQAAGISQDNEQEQASNSEVEPKKAKKKSKPQPTEKAENSLAAMLARLQDLNSGIQVGPLNSVKEVEANIDKFFSKQVTSHLDRLVGKSTGCSSYQFHPASNPYVCLNIFTCVFGKYRYPDNHAHLISKEEYDKMALDRSRFELVYRGISSQGEKRQKILESYGTADINNLDIYGNGMFGTNVYTTTSLSYARSYGTPMYGLVDRNARTIDSDVLARMQYGIDNLDKNKMISRISAKMQQYGLSPERADSIANYFMKSLRGDESLLAILLGYDYQTSDGHQRNMLNLNKWYIRKEF